MTFPLRSFIITTDGMNGIYALQNHRLSQLRE